MLNEWTTTIGVSGAIAAVGYMAEMARESFLGIELADFSFSRYATAFAYFVFNTVQVVASHPALTAFALAVVVALVLVARLNHGRRSAVALLLLTSVFAMAFGTYVLVEREIPLVLIDKVLVKNAELDLALGNNEYARRVWRHVLCAHDANKKLTACTSDEANPDWLERRYVDCVVSAGLLIGLFYVFRLLLSKSAEPDGLTSAWLALGRLLTAPLLLVISIVALMLPYAHGKLMAQTVFPQITIEYTPTDQKPSTATGYLLHRSDSSVTFYEEITAKQSGVTEVPSSRIAAVRSRTPDDVLAHHIQQTAAGPASQQKEQPSPSVPPMNSNPSGGS